MVLGTLLVWHPRWKACQSPQMLGCHQRQVNEQKKNSGSKSFIERGIGKVLERDLSSKHELPGVSRKPRAVSQCFCLNEICAQRMVHKAGAQ